MNEIQNMELYILKIYKIWRKNKKRFKKRFKKRREKKDKLLNALI